MLSAVLFASLVGDGAHTLANSVLTRLQLVLAGCNRRGNSLAQSEGLVLPVTTVAVRAPVPAAAKVAAARPAAALDVRKREVRTEMACGLDASLVCWS